MAAVLTLFQAYISGRNVIVFNGGREILQNLNVDSSNDLRAISIEEQCGRIALCDEQKVYLYEPLGRDSGDLHWNQSAAIQLNWNIHCISWASEEELLVAGQQIGLWRLVSYEGPQNTWQSHLANTVVQALVSPDGSLVASIGQYDRIVKIWRRLSWEQDSTRFDVSYLRHPSAVVNCMWRRLWYSEQSLDNLLYTFGSDDHVRVWAHADPHAYCAMQEVACIDLAASIQPRRMSIGSVSKRRFAFIIHSRDLSFAAERMLQTHKQGPDHALEHLIEIANRSPEICVVLDGLGHMSAIGLENAGHKNKREAELFNIALVDQVNLALPVDDGYNDCVVIHAFANSDLSASLCILVQSYAGQIDWYQGNFVDFFDTARRAKRIDFESSWAGHASNIEGISSDHAKRTFVSWTSERSAIIWHQQDTGILIPRNRISLEEDVVCARFVTHNLLLFLHPHSMTLWKLCGAQATLNQQTRFPRCHQSAIAQKLFVRGDRVIVLHEDGALEQYNVHLNASEIPQEQNGQFEAIQLAGELEFAPDYEPKTSFHVLSDVVTNSAVEAKHICGISVMGELRSYKVVQTSKKPRLVCMDTISTIIPKAEMLADSMTGYIACVHRGGRGVSIWSETQHSQELVHGFPDGQEVNGLEWISVQGLDILLAWFDHSFCTITRGRYSESSLPWTIHPEVRVRKYTTYVIETVCWLTCPSVAVAAGNQILVFDAINGTPTTQDRYQEIALSPLPIFHPASMSTLLFSGHLATVENLFVKIHEQTKHFSDIDSLDVLLDLDVSWLIQDDSAQSSHNTKEKDTSDYADGVNRIPAFQLNDSQRANLGRLSKTVSYLRGSVDALDCPSQIYWQTFLTLAQDTPAFSRPLPYSAILAATLSQTPEALLEQVQSYLAVYCPRLKLDWSLSRKLGLFLFLPTASISPSNPETTLIKDLFEQIARNEYNNPHDSDTKSPVDCSLYYLALSKKAVLQALWRRTVGVKEKDNTMRLLSNDFTHPKWKATALKNAYALLSKRRFEYAAAFFLLGGALNDAVNICVNQLDDPQLGIAIARVWHDAIEGNRAMKNVINGSMQELALDTWEARFLLAWGKVQLEDLAGAVRCLALHIEILLRGPLDTRAQAALNSKLEQRPPECLSFRANEPTVLLELYKHLRETLHMQGQWIADSQNLISSSQEWSLVLRCVDWYRRAGLDLFALRLVRNWKFLGWQNKAVSDKGTKSDQKPVMDYIDDVSELENMLAASGSHNKAERRTQPAEAMPSPSDRKPAPTQFVEPSADSLLDSFGF